MQLKSWFRSYRLPLLLVALATVLAACGADDDDPGPDPAAEEEADDEAEEPAEEEPADEPEEAADECDELTSITVRLNWVYNYNQVPLMVAHDRGYYEDECLDVSLEAGDGSADTVTSVASGAADVGLSDAIAVMQGQAQDLPVTGVGVLWRQNAFALLARQGALEEHGIDDLQPDDLEDLLLGAVTTGSPYIFWQAFIDQQGLDPDAIEQVSISPPGFAELAQGSVDFIANFSGARFALERQGVEVEMLLGQDHGQEGYGLSFLANDDWLAEDGSDEALRGFLRATARGMLYSGEHDVESMDHVAAFNPDVGLDEEAAEQERLPHLDSVELWADGGMDSPEDFLQFDEEGLRSTQALLYDAEILEGEPFEVMDYWTDEYLPDPDEYLD